MATESELLVECDQLNKPEGVLSPEQSMPEESVESSNGDLVQSGSSLESRTLFQLNTGVAGDKYLQLVEQRVLEENGDCISLKSRSGSYINLKIAGIGDTIYTKDSEEVNSWGKFYLPQEVKMRVFGVVEGTSCPCDQLVLMTCGNDTVYGYDGEELHEMASNLQELRDVGLEYPASKSYYYGQAFKDMSDADWAEVRKGAVGQRLDEEHQELVKNFKFKFLECLS